MVVGRYRIIKKLPERLPTKKDILKIYTDEEHEKIVRYIDNETIPYRSSTTPKKYVDNPKKKYNM